MLPEKQNKLPKTLQLLSQTELSRTLVTGNFKAASELLPSRINEATKQPPICELIKVTGTSQVVRFIEFELIKMSSLVSVGNNLNNAQVEFIATQLVEMFPNESLADFKICFQRGCIGQYGDIFRMDGIVLRKWMEKYLDEKYTVIEEDLRKAKQNDYHETPPPAEVGPGRKLFDEYANSLRMGTKIPGIPHEDIVKEGQEKPKQKTGTGHPRITEAGIEASRRQDLMREYGKLHTDIYTGKKLEGSPSFEEWIETKAN